MPKLNTLDLVGDAQHVLVYGAPKTGKTELVGRLSKHFDLFWIDLENGSTTLTKLPLEQQMKVDLYRINDTPKKPVGIVSALKIFEGKTTLCEVHGKTNCALCKKANDQEKNPIYPIDIHNQTRDTIVVLDSLTQLSASALNHVLNLDGIENSSRAEVTFNHYGVSNILLTNLMTMIQNSRVHVVCISHETNVVHDDKSEKITPTLGTKNLSRGCAKYFDHVVLMEIKNKKHTGMSSSVATNNKIGGSRLDIDISMKDGLAPFFGIAPTVSKDKPALAAKPKVSSTTVTPSKPKLKFN
tara:strand:+ start:1284 stop:2177 length:894 start_codon:yes stop_codon:yes gene_type:complete